MHIIQEDPWAGATNSGLEHKEKTPEKPSPPKIVNQPPVAAVVDEKSDQPSAKQVEVGEEQRRKGQQRRQNIPR